MPMACLRQVMLVENNPADAALVTRVFDEAKARNRLIHFDDCQQALTHLQSRSAKKPTLILVALKASDRGALQFLAALKEDETLRMIPVVALAESGEPQDVSASFARGVAGYIMKSADPAKLREDITAICTYWALSQSPPP
jgi:CheY-like chemotaxis protein